MSVTVAAVMRQINNHFVRGYVDGEFSIVNGVLSPAPSAAYVYVAGSMMHDGAWKSESGFLYGAEADDETFTGRVWLLAPPADFLALCEDIRRYAEATPTGAVTSERFGEYAVTRAAGAASTWQHVYAAALAPYRRMYREDLGDGTD